MRGLIEAGFVDEVPHQPRHVFEACHDSGDELLLAAHGLGIEIGVGAAEIVGDECEEGKLHRNVVTPRRQQERFEVAESRVLYDAWLFHELIPRRPEAGADHVNAVSLHLCEVVVPYERIRLHQVLALHIAGHVRSADNRLRLAVDEEEVLVKRDCRAGAQRVAVVYPVAGAVLRDEGVTLHESCCHRMQSTLRRGRHLQAREEWRLRDIQRKRLRYGRAALACIGQLNPQCRRRGYKTVYTHLKARRFAWEKQRPLRLNKHLTSTLAGTLRQSTQILCG